MPNPIDILSQGLKINPKITRLAFAIPIVLAAVAVGINFFSDPRSAFFAGVAGFLALLLVIAITYALTYGGLLGPAGVALAWFTTVLFMAVCVVIFTSWAFDKPKAMTCLFRPLDRCEDVVAEIASRKEVPATSVNKSDYLVKFQFAGFTREQAQAISAELKEKGWRILGEERVADAARWDEVRYRDPADKLAAELLAKETNQTRRVNAEVTAKQNSTIKAKELELWFHLH